jgi:CRP-like cAMP-binding protein
MALVGLDARSATVRALVDTVTMRFYAETVDANVTSASYIYRNVANILAKRLKESSINLANMTAKPA